MGSMEDPPSYDAVLEASQAPYASGESAHQQPSDTKVTVTDPVQQRGAGGGQFMSYKVTTTSKNPKYKCCNAGSSIVMRRFSEFHLLFRKLRAEFPGAVVPPCPEKNQLQKLRKTPAFIEARRQALEVFVNKVCGHRHLRHADLLRAFLEADEATWQMELQRLRQADEQTSVLGTVSTLATDIFQSTKNLAKGQSDDRSEEPEYLQFKEYSTQLEHHLKDASSRSADFVAKQQAYGEALSTFGTQAHNMSKFEEGGAAAAFLELQAAAEKVATMHADASEHVGRIFAAPLKEQHLAVKSVKDTQHDRSVALQHKLQAESALKHAKARLAQLRSSGKPDAVLNAEEKLAAAAEANRKASDEYDALVARMRDELVEFQAARSADLTRALRDFALAQAKLAKQSALHWRGLSERMGPLVEQAGGAASTAV